MLAKAGLEKRQAQMWMEVARNPRFVNASPDSLLPPCMTTLHQIGKLPDDVYQGLRAEGVINPLVTRDDIKAVISGMKQKADEQRILGLAPVSYLGCRHCLGVDEVRRGRSRLSVCTHYPGGVLAAARH